MGQSKLNENNVLLLSSYSNYTGHGIGNADGIGNQANPNADGIGTTALDGIENDFFGEFWAQNHPKLTENT